MNEISRNLIDAYNAAKFRVFDGNIEITLNQNLHSEELAVLHDKHNVTTSAIITAYNPYSEDTDHFINEIAQKGLIEFASMRWKYLMAEGFDPSGHWLPEPSILILGIELHDAISLGNKFKQNAIVYISESGKVDLYDCASWDLLQNYPLYQ